MNNRDEELLVELLLQWEELYERGQDSSPQELCRDCPHLIEELGKRIAAMKATNWLNNPDCPADSPAAPTSQSAGKVLSGRYRLDDLIATGGFAEVWRAFDTELQRIVAIKLPKPNRLASATNFITEARRVARLKHPGIVPVFDVGTEGNNCFIVSEYVEGGSLGDRLTKSPPTPKETSRWLSEIAAALEYAHLHGVIHRDIKPANILIDHHGRALLADFGIAQSAQKTGTFAPSLGTLRYMSPEQLEGKAATPQSDVYSLGVVLHECLTGRLPYSSNEPSVLRREIVGGAKQLAKDGPAALLDVCQKAMKRLPHERHTSAAHFATELDKAAGKALPRGSWWRSSFLWLAVFALPLMVVPIASKYFAVIPAKDRPSPLAVARPPNPSSPDKSSNSLAPKSAPEPIHEVKVLPSLTNSIGMKLIEIPAGTFFMGPHNGPASRKVQITRSFYLGQYEVTNAQWDKVMGSELSEFKPADHPVGHFSWEDGVEFCRRLSSLPDERVAGRVYRLPTEAEWEYACRAGSKSEFSFGEDTSLVGDYAWFHGNSGEQSHPVGQKKPNAWGLYDMHGNVWEWCQDWFGEYDGGTGIDPRGPSTGVYRVNRGGSFHTDAWYLPSNRRSYNGPGNEVLHTSIGMRVAMNCGSGTGPSTALPAANDARGVQLRTRDNLLGMKLIEIPAGYFYMGSDRGNPDERPVHKTMITRPFYMGQTEVTQEQWLKVMGTPRWKEREYCHEGPNHAASCVDWFEAVEFCNKLTQLDRDAGVLGENEKYALPTEAQWEYACRAGTVTTYSYGDDPDLLSYFAWWGGIWGDGNAKKEQYPHDVAKKKPNPWGLYDMHGNVYEWCSDWYGADYYGKSPKKDPKGPEEGVYRVLRSGGWITYAHFCRSTIRFPDNPPDGRWQHVGFRVVLNVEPAPSPGKALTSVEIDRQPFAEVLVIAPEKPMVRDLKDGAVVSVNKDRGTFTSLPAELSGLKYSLLPAEAAGVTGIRFTTAGRVVVGTTWQQRAGFQEQKWAAYLAKQAVKGNLACGGLELWDVVANAGDTVLLPPSCVVMTDKIEAAQLTDDFLAQPVSLDTPYAEVLVESARPMPRGIVGDAAFGVKGRVPEDFSGLAYAIHGTDGPLPASQMPVVITFKSPGRIAYLTNWRGGMFVFTDIDNQLMRYFAYRRMNERLDEWDIWDIVGEPGKRVVVPEWGKILAEDIEVQVTK